MIASYGAYDLAIGERTRSSPPSAPISPSPCRRGIRKGRPRARTLPNRRHRHSLPKSPWVRATVTAEARGRSRSRLASMQALEGAENINALHNSDSFGGAVAAWAGYLLHDGWIPSHPARTCRHHDPGASHPRSAHLSRRSAAEVVMSIPGRDT
jgi:hypothetical protein